MLVDQVLHYLKINKEIIKRLYIKSWKKLKSLLHANHENEAFKEACSAKDKIDSSDIGKGIIWCSKHV